MLLRYAAPTLAWRLGPAPPLPRPLQRGGTRGTVPRCAELTPNRRPPPPPRSEAEREALREAAKRERKRSKKGVHAFLDDGD